MSRGSTEEPQGEVRFHHIVQGQLGVLDARGCSHCWKVFHTTYSFCLVVRLAPCVVRWKYNRRIYEVDPKHLTMAMQPGEVHANLEAHPPGDFIVVQVGDELMKEVAQGLGWRSANLNLRQPDCNHPALLNALRVFHQGLCPTLYDAASGNSCCTCALSLNLHLENLVQVVAAFIQHGAEDAKELANPCIGAALISRAIEYLREAHMEPYCLDRLMREVDPGGNYSRFYLVRAFKNAIGVSPHEFQNLILAGKTRDALAAGSAEPFSRIVSDVGWPGNGDEGSDRVRAAYTHFARTWRTTPGQFRKDAGIAADNQRAFARLKEFT